MTSVKLRETKDLEYKLFPNEKTNKKKEDFKSYLKTVSAFANYLDGKIIFGISDDKEIIPFQDPEQMILDLENQINDNIVPLPNCEFDTNEDGTVSLRVFKGKDTPYLYKGIAYRRSDSSSVPVDRAAYVRLCLEGSNLSFEDMPSSLQDLTFDTLENWILTKTDISQFSTDTLKTLSLYSDEGGSTNAGQILSDQNQFSTAGFIRFGSGLSEILFSRHFGSQSILRTFEEICDLFLQQYSYETITGFERVTRIRIPEVAFREALANALIHRDWSIPAEINIACFSDRIVMTSPGGLPEGLTREMYTSRYLSVPRNYHLATVFNRLHIIEKFGTGIQRIVDAYRSSATQPEFEITDSSVTVILPVFQDLSDLPKEALQILNLLKNGPKKRTELYKACIGTQYSVNKNLALLLERKLIEKEGKTRGQIYSLMVSD